MLNRLSKHLVILIVCFIGLFTVVSFLMPIDAFAEEQDRDLVIVSLGDSYSSGEGIEKFYEQDLPLDEKVGKNDWLAHRSENAWAGMLCLPGLEGGMASHRNENWFFVAASGAETKDISGRQKIEFDRYEAGASPNSLKHRVGWKLLPAQIDVFNPDSHDYKMNGKEADYVTITLGGNDLGFGDIIAAYATSDLTGYGELNRLLDLAVVKLDNGINNEKSVRDKLKDVYRLIGEKAGKQAKILVVGYPMLCCEEGQYITEKLVAAPPDDSKHLLKNAKMLNDKIRYFNEALKTIVNECKSELNIEYVSVQEAFGENGEHGVGSSDPWINPVILTTNSTQDLITYKIGSSYSFHPNLKGAMAYAECVQKAINENEGVELKIVMDGPEIRSVWVQPEEERIKENLKNYSPFLDELAVAWKLCETSDDSNPTILLSDDWDICSDFCRGPNIQYGFQDLNLDGADELIVTFTDEYYEDEPFGMLTMIDGKPVIFARPQVRSRILPDKNGIIYISGNDSVNEYFSGKYKWNGDYDKDEWVGVGNFVPIECIFGEADYNRNVEKYYKSKGELYFLPGESGEHKNATEISKEKFEEIRVKYEEDYKKAGAGPATKYTIESYYQTMTEDRINEITDKLKKVADQRERENSGEGNEDIENILVAYDDYIKSTLGSDALPYVYCIYLNDDTIPELIVDTQTGMGGAYILTYGSDGVDSCDLWRSEYYFWEKQNVLNVSAGKQGIYIDEFIKIEDGKFNCFASGSKEILPEYFNDRDWEQDEKWSCEWNGKEISRTEYNMECESISPEGGTYCMDIYDEQVCYTYDIDSIKDAYEDLLVREETGFRPRYR